VRVLDNLEPNTHKRGKTKLDQIQGGIRSRDLRRVAKRSTPALDKIDIVFHQAAYGGYMPRDFEIQFYVNSFGTAQMLEIIREKSLPIKKIVVASSQAVYSEGRRDLS